LIKNEDHDKEETDDIKAIENEEDETNEENKKYRVTFSFKPSEEQPPNETFLSKNINKLNFKYPILLDYDENERERDKISSLTQNFNHVTKKLHPKSLLLPLVDQHDAKLSKKRCFFCIILREKMYICCCFKESL
jgi:hypothetical protein